MNPRLNLRPIAPSEVNRQALSYYFYMQLVEVISRLRSAWHDSNSDLVGRIFSLEFGFDVSQKDFERIIRKELEPPLSDATVSLVKRSLALRQNNIPEAYRAHTAMTKSLLLAPGDPTFRWALAPVLFRDLRRLAAAGDDQLGAAGENNPELLEDASRELIMFFGRAPPEHKLLVSINLIRMGAKRNNLSLMANVKKNLESSNLPALSSFPISQQVTHRYFMGRMAMLETNYAKSSSDLSFVLAQCPRQYAKNRRLALITLIPVNMMLLKLPSLALLRRYNLLQYADLRRAVKSGDLALFKRSIAQHQEFFIRAGVFLLLQRLELLCFRGFFRRAAMLLGDTQLPLGTFEYLLRAVGNPVDLFEIECLLALLIRRGFIKGYIHHPNRILVVAKKDAFPPMATIKSAWWE